MACRVPMLMHPARDGQIMLAACAEISGISGRSGSLWGGGKRRFGPGEGELKDSSTSTLDRRCLACTPYGIKHRCPGLATLSSFQCSEKARSRQGRFSTMISTPSDDLTMFAYLRWRVLLRPTCPLLRELPLHPCRKDRPFRVDCGGFGLRRRQDLACSTPSEATALQEV